MDHHSAASYMIPVNAPRFSGIMQSTWKKISPWFAFAPGLGACDTPMAVNLLQFNIRTD